MLSNWDNTSAGSWCSAAIFTLSEWPVSLESYCRIRSLSVVHCTQCRPIGHIMHYNNIIITPNLHVVTFLSHKLEVIHVCTRGNKYFKFTHDIIVTSHERHSVSNHRQVDWFFSFQKLLQADKKETSNWGIFRVTGPLWGGFTGHRPVTRSFDVFFDLRPNKWLSKQSRRRWFETPSRPLWRHCNESA